MEEQIRQCDNNQKAPQQGTFPHKSLEERIQESGCELSGIGEIDWGDPQGNEIW